MSKSTKFEKPTENEALSQEDRDLFLNYIESIDDESLQENKIFEDTSTQKPVHKSPPLSVRIDLHGNTVEGAKKTVREKVQDSLNNHMQFDVKIITGRGRHSQNGPVLADAIYKYFVETFKDFIVKIEANPAEASINQISVRGHFSATMKNPRRKPGRG